MRNGNVRRLKQKGDDAPLGRVLGALHAMRVEEVGLDRDAKAGAGRYSQRTVGVENKRWIDQVLLIIAFAGRYITWQDESREASKCDIVSATYARFQHSAMPNRHISAVT
jgi:hypothetical protein